MKKKKIGIAMIMASVILVSGCAQKADSIKATYVSPIGYERLSCNQLKDEVLRVNKRLSIISGEQASVANKDAVTMGVGVLLFPPALLFMAAGDDQKAEIGNLKGQYDTIRDIATKKNCSFAAGMR
jgi:hypothetical protein